MAYPSIDRERAASAGLTALVVAGLGYALVAGLAVSLPVKPADVMKLFAVPVPPPPPPVEKPPPPHLRRAASEGASAPPNIKSKATDIVAPKPVVPPIQPPPITTAPVPSVGADATSGATLTMGPGTGAGGEGNGTGSGRFGNGSGAGGTPARQLSEIRFRDLPQLVREALFDSPTDYTVYVRFTVTTEGRAVDCRVTRSSGYPALDVGTCQAIVQRLRFKPERDASGRPVTTTFAGPQEWPALGTAPPPDDRR